ncbi:UNVERIFIED_CONTAM: hypothetical protein Sradi_5021700 [Sesamum radiatum]|uniref:Uncharacterized protein n=1 Tax=Sesamum radiatum TaxID=300843 RepID=A0AAW2MG61_SESRA
MRFTAFSSNFPGCFIPCGKCTHINAITAYLHTANLPIKATANSVHTGYLHHQSIMDRRLHESVTGGDVVALSKLVEQDDSIIRQRVIGSLNTVLHVAARFGHLELAKEIVEKWPEMVSLENAYLPSARSMQRRAPGNCEIVAGNRPVGCL